MMWAAARLSVIGDLALAQLRLRGHALPRQLLRGGLQLPNHLLDARHLLRRPPGRLRSHTKLIGADPLVPPSQSAWVAHRKYCEHV